MASRSSGSLNHRIPIKVQSFFSHRKVFVVNRLVYYLPTSYPLGEIVWCSKTFSSCDALRHHDNSAGLPNEETTLTRGTVHRCWQGGHFDGKPCEKDVEFKLHSSFTYASGPKVIAPNKTFSTSTDPCIAKVLPDFNGLIDRSVTVSKIGRLGIAKVNSKALCRAAIDNMSLWIAL